MSDKSRLENNNLELMNIYNAVENLPGADGDVKLYDSITNMNLDHNVDDGQLAIVYYNESANITANTEFQIGTFPEIVALPTAAGYFELEFSAVDESVMFECYGQLNSRQYSIDCYTYTSEIKIEYSSQDGITYTRTQFRKNNEEISGNEMDFGLTIKFGGRWSSAQWDDRIGYFTQIRNVAFDGLYQYIDNSYDLAKTQFTVDKDVVYQGTFYGKNGVEIGSVQNVTNLSISQLQTRVSLYSDISNLSLNENVTSLYMVFGGYYNLVTVPNFDTSNVINIYGMFYECSGLTTVPNFNTSNVTNMGGMFSDCFKLTNVPEFDTSNVISMGGMFQGCENLTTVPNYNTSKVTSMSSMFFGCENLTTVPNFDTSKVTNMDYMFTDCNNLTTVPNFDTSKVTDMSGMFSGCYNLTNVPQFNTSNVTDMMRMFINCNNLSNDSYVNIANSLPLAVNLPSDSRNISNIGLNIENFTLEQKQILGNKGYYDALQYVVNTSNLSASWNILYS